MTSNIFINLPENKKSFLLISDPKKSIFFTPIHFQTRINISELENNFMKIKNELKHKKVLTIYIQTKNEEISISDKYTDTSHFRSNYYLDLSKSTDDLINNHKRDSKQRLKKALSKSTNFVTNQKDISNFIDNYEKKQTANNFGENYKYNKDDWNLLINTNHIKYLEVQEKNKFLAGGFFAKNYKDVDYLYGVSSDEFVDATRILIFKAAIYFKQKKFDRLYLGGGTEEGDQLANFKSRMGTIQSKCKVIRSIINIDDAEKIYGQKFNKNWFSNYFPPFKI